jgi:hypothetical protein
MVRNFCGGLLAAFILLGAGELAAQETGTPMFKAPYRCRVLRSGRRRPICP